MSTSLNMRRLVACRSVQREGLGVLKSVSNLFSG